MDIIDHASAQEARARDAEIARVRQLADQPAAATYSGFCLFCGDITGGGRRFCSAECRDDHALLLRVQRIKGRR